MLRLKIKKNGFQLAALEKVYFWRKVSQPNFSPDLGAKLFLKHIQKKKKILPFLELKNTTEQLILL